MTIKRMSGDNPIEIKDNEKVLAIVFPHDLPADGVRFLTPETYPLQIGLLEHKQGKFVPAHHHPHLKYDVVNTQEWLYVIKGDIEVEIFNHEWKSFHKSTLVAGDSVLFVDCGHAVNLPASSRVIEVKQGPYPGVKESKVFRDEELNKKLQSQ